MIHIVTRATKHFLIWSIILGAVSITGLRLFLAEIKTYKQLLATRISVALDVPVSIGTLQASLRGFEPEIVLKDIAVFGTFRKQADIYVRELHLGINLVDFIKNWQFFSPQTVTIVGAKFSMIRDTDNAISIVGLQAGEDDPLWLLQGKRYQILDSEFSWRDMKNDRKELTFKHINVFFEIDPERVAHRINLHMQLPETLGKSLTIASQFSGDLADLFDPKKINGRVYVKGQSLQLSELMIEDLYKGFQIDNGIGDFELWSTWEQSGLNKLTGKVQLQQGKVTRLDGEVLLVDQLSTLFQFQKEMQQWRINLDHFSMQQQEQSSEHRNVSLLLKRDKQQQVHKVSVSASVLELAHLSHLALFFRLPDQQQTQWLENLQIKGKIKDLMLFADIPQHKTAINVIAEKFSVSPVDNMPGLKNFSGFIQGTEQTGLLQLATVAAAIEFPKIFSNALKIKKLQGKVNWRRHLDNLEISSQMLALDTPDIKTLNTLKLIIPENDQNHFLDLQSEFFDGRDLAKVKHYLPTKIMDQAIVEWLEDFFVAGDVEQGKGLFYGNIQNFPFASGNGVFEVLFNAKAAVLEFDPAWPKLTHVDAGVLFLGESLEVTGYYGRLQGTEIQWADISIPELGVSEYLLVNGETIGTIEQGLDFILLSPLKEWVLPVLENIAPKGKAHVAVNLAVPLVDAVAAKTNISIHLDQAQVSVLPLDMLVTQISGDLQISESEITSDNFTATALGYPVSMKINHQDEQTRLEFAGQSDINNLHQQFPSPWWQHAQGKLAYNILFSIPDDEQSSAQLLLTSDLEGVALTLPDNLIKTQHEQRQFALQFELSEASLMPVKLNYMDEFKVALNFNTESQQIDSANILYGEGQVDFLSQPEVHLQVKRETLNLDAWLEFSGSLDEQISSAVSEKINNVDIQIQQLVWQINQQGKFDLQLQNEENFWNIKTHNRFMQGNLSIPIQSNVNSNIKLNLDVLNISALSQINLQNGSESSLSPLQVPGFMLSSRKVLWHSVDLGQLTFQALKQTNGLIFKKFDLIANDKKLSLKGSWTIDNEQQQTYVNGLLDIDDLGGLLTQLDVTHAMQGSDAFFDYVLYWSDAPHQVSLDKITGTLRVDLEEGLLLGVEPGMGRVLGLLDLWQLTRRLQFDFSDVYADGFAYNRIYGSFLLGKGDAVTDDLIVEGLPAKIEIKGRTGLVTKDFDQIITVLPKSSVVVPIAGTIIGRVADYIQQSWTKKKHVGGFFNSSQYALQGKWSDVEVTPLYENDGLFQKAWKGITGINGKPDEQAIQ